jgi:hypothetical protein
MIPEMGLAVLTQINWWSGPAGNVRRCLTGVP